MFSKLMYRNIFIVESLATLPAFVSLFDQEKDLVLTYDFALKKQISKLGGESLYVDKLCEQSTMQKNNFLMYQFFREWHIDAQGADIFRYKDIDFGFSFRIEIWNSFTFYIRNRLCIEQLRKCSYQKIYVDSKLPLIQEILNDMNLIFMELDNSINKKGFANSYFFPIHRWMRERLRGRWIHHISQIFLVIQGLAISWFDRVAQNFDGGVRIFIQEYHPTRQLMLRLQKFPGIKVSQAHFSATAGLKKFLSERPIPIYGRKRRYQIDADMLFRKFQRRRSARLVLHSGVDITKSINRVIEQKIIEVLPEMLRTLDCVISHLNKLPIHLEILIANIGQVAIMVDCVAKSRGIPSFMIINGILGSAYLDEAKYATIINAYSTSIRDNYFRGMNNIVCLGDPRMDAYAYMNAKIINRVTPTISIGASGYSPIDLNSYLAVEFEFLYEVLSAICNFSAKVPVLRIILKIRSNGYYEQYKNFVKEYFPDIHILIMDNVPMREVLIKSDLFISIYSQTLFEASCLGIPVIYHKTDQEIMDPPFDGNSELVTTYNTFDLTQALYDFMDSHSRYDSFLNKAVMEKYIGPLDGKNCERNLKFALDMLNRFK